MSSAVSVYNKVNQSVPGLNAILIQDELRRGLDEAVAKIGASKEVQGLVKCL